MVAKNIDMVFKLEDGKEGLESALEDLFKNS